MPRRRGPRKPLLFDPLAFRGRVQVAMASRGFRQQKELAVAGGIDEGQLSRVLSKAGLPGITADVVIRLARGLDVPVGWLLSGDGDPVGHFVHEPQRRPAARRRLESLTG
jgi:transcriptional regulator with XRE-family HTH domain